MNEIKEKNFNTLVEKMRTFLEKDRPSDGGWGELSSEDHRYMWRMFIEFAELATSPDPDGDYPFQIIVVNRNTHYSLPFKPVPYDKTIESPDENVFDEEYFERITYNLSVAFDDFDRANKIRKFIFYRNKNSGENHDN